MTIRHETANSELYEFLKKRVTSLFLLRLNHASLNLAGAMSL
jgi:hypothetical protein